MASIPPMFHKVKKDNELEAIVKMLIAKANPMHELNDSIKLERHHQDSSDSESENSGTSSESEDEHEMKQKEANEVPEDNIDALTNRLKISLGEIGAGNDSKLLWNQALAIRNKLYSKKMMSQGDYIGVTRFLDKHRP